MTAMQIIDNLEALNGEVGRDVEHGDGMTIDQKRIRQFADPTGDHQWIYPDAKRARHKSPQQSPIAHGYRVLTFLPALFTTRVRIVDVGMTINYALDRVRLPVPALIGRWRGRGRQTLDWFEAVTCGVQLFWNYTVVLEQSDKPVCVAQLLAS